jgi:hypothetical protein
MRGDPYLWRALAGLLLSLACGRPSNPATGPLLIERRTPLPGAFNVWIRDPIEVRFSRSVNPETITPESLVVYADGVAVGRSIESLEDGKLLRIHLDSPPAVPVTMKVTLTSAIGDLWRNSLAVPEGDWTWELPVWQAPGGEVSLNYESSQDAGWPALAVSASGEIFVAFAEPVGGVSSLAVNHWAGTAWERLDTVANVESGMPVGDEPPSIAIDEAGRPVVAFTQSNGAAMLLYVRRWKGSVWETIGGPLNADQVALRDVYNPALGIDGAGHVAVAWEEDTATADVRNVYVRRWEDGVWTEPTVLNKDTTATAHEADIAFDSAGRAYVVFRETPQWVVNVRRVDWSTGSPILDSFRDNPVSASTSLWGASPVIVASGDAIYLSWYGPVVGGGPTLISVQRCDPSSESLNCSQLGDSLRWTPQGLAGTPSLALLDSGIPVVAWDEKDSADPETWPQVAVAYAWTGSSWEPLPGIPIAVDPSQIAHVPKLAVTDGQLVAVWREAVAAASSAFNIFVKRYNQ